MNTAPRGCSLRRVLLALAWGAGIAAVPHAAADELGRLFFTPQQRQDLDHRRERNIQEKEVVVESSVTVNGKVTRSSGKTTTWVNGVS